MLIPGLIPLGLMTAEVMPERYFSVGPRSSRKSICCHGNETVNSEKSGFDVDMWYANLAN